VFNGRVRAARAEWAVVDDVEATLADLERRLHALQAELAHEDENEGDGAPAPAAERRPGRLRVEGVDTRPPGEDPLHAFGDRLRRTAADLLAAYDDAVGQARGGEGELFDAEVALEARADLPALCALAQALAAVPGVHAVDLRAYAGGHAALDVALDRPVALVAELRARSPAPFGVLASRPGRLVLEVGAPDDAQEFSRG
jgi:hypothetical protein